MGSISLPAETQSADRNSVCDRLSMDVILKESVLDKKSRELVKATVLARLISPASEASTLKWIKERSSVAEIINTDLLNIKTDLGIRPVYHQTAGKSMGHLFISVLAYHLLNTIELALASKARGSSGPP